VKFTHKLVNWLTTDHAQGTGFQLRIFYPFMPTAEK